MRPPSTTTPRSGTVTLCVAWGVLAAVAGVQAFIGFGGVGRPAAKSNVPNTPVVAKLEVPNEPALPTPPTIPAVPQAPVVTVREELPPLESLPTLEATMADVAPSPPAEPVPAPTPMPVITAPPSLDVPLTDEVILASLEKGLFYQERGDLVEALPHFRLAWERLPDHPRLIYQLARVYDLMGLEKRSAPLWRSLKSLGRAAGDYALLTEQRFTQNAELLEAAAVGEEPKEPAAAKPTKQLMVASVKTTKDTHERGGERQMVTFAVKKAIAESVSPEDVAIVVHFFETLNGRKIDRSQLPEEPQIFQLAAPLDWPKGEDEPMQVDYFQPRMSPAEILKFGHRTHYGQLIEVFYKGQLADSFAEPPELAALAREIPLTPAAPADPPPTEDVPLIPQPAATAPAGVDPSLFPTK